MANNINLQETEYDEVSIKLKKLHSNTISQVSKTIKEMYKLFSKDDGFSDDKIEPKVKKLLNSIRKYVIPVMKDIYDYSEKSIEKFMSSIKNIDTVEK